MGLFERLKRRKDEKKRCCKDIGAKKLQHRKREELLEVGG
jgi:hypothetical protein